jgi:hypothetical protein
MTRTTFKGKLELGKNELQSLGSRTRIHNRWLTTLMLEQVDHSQKGHEEGVVYYVVYAPPCTGKTPHAIASWLRLADTKPIAHGTLIRGETAGYAASSLPFDVIVASNAIDVPKVRIYDYDWDWMESLSIALNGTMKTTTTAGTWLQNKFEKGDGRHERTVCTR